jgi:predicted Zn-dependent protease
MSTLESRSSLTADVRSEWTGFYYDGQTAAKRSVTVTVRQGGIELDVDDRRPRFWPFHDLRQTQGWLPGELLRLEVGSEPVQAIIINEPGLPEAIRARGGAVSRSVRGKTRTARILGGMAAIIVAGAALYFWLAPRFADWAAQRVPPAWEISLGERAEPRLAPLSSQCTDSTTMAGLRVVLDRLVKARPGSPYKFRIVALRDPSVNAFAAPGGLIAVNQGLLAEARSPEELAGVLAHEMQHIYFRHSTRAILREVPMRFAIGALVGGTGIETAASAAGTIGAFTYRRDDELEADREGLRLLWAAGIAREPVADFIERLEKEGETQSGIATYLSTHPAPGQRAAELRRLGSLEKGPTRPIMDPAAFAALRTACAR